MVALHRMISTRGRLLKRQRLPLVLITAGQFIESRVSICQCCERIRCLVSVGVWFYASNLGCDAIKAFFFGLWYIRARLRRRTVSTLTMRFRESSNFFNVSIGTLKTCRAPLQNNHRSTVKWWIYRNDDDPILMSSYY